MSNETGRSRFTRWRPRLADHCWFVWYEPTVTTATTAVTGPEAQPGAAPEAIGRRADAARARLQVHPRRASLHRNGQRSLIRSRLTSSVG